MISRHFYPQMASIEWVQLEQAWPGAVATPIEPGVEPEPIMCLVMTDAADGTQHVVPFDSEGRVRLVRLLTGGVVLPKGVGSGGQ